MNSDDKFNEQEIVKLRQSYKELLSMVENAPVLIMQIDKEGVIQYINNKSYEIIGTNAYDYVLPEYRDIVKNTVDEVFKTGKKGEYEILRVDEVNETCWYKTDVGPIFQDDKIVSVSLFTIDITERRESEEKNRFLSSFVEQSSEGMSIADLDGTLLFINKAWAEMHGYETGEELIGQPLGIFCSKEQIENEVIPFNKKVMEKGSNSGEIGHIRKNGTPFPTLMNTTLLKDNMGNPVAIAAVAKDITDIKWLFDKLEERTRELEKSNRELKEATVQLIQAEKLSALGELTAGVAHELNQPLNGMKIICQSILRDIDRNRFEKEEFVEDLNEVVGQINKMAGIIDHMRIYSRYSDATIKEEVDLNSIVEGPFKLLGQQFSNQNIKVLKNLSPDLPYIIGDPIRLEQVFMNLITNARNSLKNSDKDDKTIEIKSYELKSDKSPLSKSSLIVEIKDNGNGIPDELKDKIFQPFFTTSQPGQGTGLGLSVSNKIIEEHNGIIELESNKDGALFKVILPF